MQMNRVCAAQFQRLAPALNTPAKHTHWPVTDMTTRVSRVRDNRISTAQPSQSDSSIRRVAADGSHICLFHAEEINNLILGHALNLINVARTLVITIDLIPLVWMALGIASHKIRVLHSTY